MKIPNIIRQEKKIFLKIASEILFLILWPKKTPVIAGIIANADQPDNSKVRIFFVLSETISIRVNAVKRIPIDCINVSLRNPIAWKKNTHGRTKIPVIPVSVPLINPIIGVRHHSYFFLYRIWGPTD